MIIVNTDYISGKNIATISIVKGSTIQTVHMGKDIAASFKTLIGGELTSYNEMMEKAREVAMERMIREAEDLGADGIVNVRFMTSSIMQSASEIMVYGTAVKFV